MTPADTAKAFVTHLTQRYQLSGVILDPASGAGPTTFSKLEVPHGN